MEKRKTQRKNPRSIPAVFMAFVLLVSLLGMNAYAAGEVCELDGTTDFFSLDTALASITDGAPHTIKLLTDINYLQHLVISAQNISFDLNNHSLNVEASDVGLKVESGGTVTLAGVGSLNVEGAISGLQVEGTGSAATVTTAQGTTTGNFAVSAKDGGKATVLQNVTAAGSGVYADQNGVVDIGGDVLSDSTGNYSVYASGGGQIHIAGSVTSSLAAAGEGVRATNSTSSVTVDGDVYARAPGAIGVYAYDHGTITVGGGVEATYDGARAENSSRVIVKNGNVTATDSSSNGLTALQGGHIEVQHGSVSCGFVGANATGSSDNTDSGTPSTIIVSGDVASNAYGAEASAHYAAIHIGGDVTGTTDKGVQAEDTGIVTVTGSATGGDYGAYARDQHSKITIGGNAEATNNGGIGAYAEGGATIDVAGTAHCTLMGGYGAYAYTNARITVGGAEGDPGTGTTGGGALAGVGGTVTVNGLVEGGTYARIITQDGTIVDTPKTPADFDQLMADDGYFHYSDATFSPVPTDVASVLVKTTLTVTLSTSLSEGQASLSGDAAAGSGPSINADVIGRGFVYGTSVDPTLSTGTSIPSGSSPGSFTGTLNVPQNTTYHVRAYATNGAGTIYSDDKVVSTVVSTTPNVHTDAATGVTSVGATLSGRIAAAGSAGITEYGFVYSTSSGPTVLTGTKVPGSGSTTVFTAALTGLTPATTYHVRAYAVKGAAAYGNEIIFWSGTGTTQPIGGGAPAASDPMASVLDSQGVLSNSLKPSIQSGLETVSVPSPVLETAFNASKPDEKGRTTVTITIPQVGSGNAYMTALPADFFKQGSAAQAIKISTSLGAVTIPGNMLPTLASGAQKVSITIAPADTSKLNTAIREQISGRPVIELALAVDGKTTPWSNDSSPVTVSIPYVPTAEELKDPEHIVVWYIDGSGTAVPVPNGRYDAATGRVVFTTTHFNQFSVAFVQKTFSDLDGYDWAQKAIEILASKGIINGTSTSSFSPEKDITRADFLTLLVKTLGLTATFKDNFDDVQPGTYYYNAIGIAKALGIATGAADNRFNPLEPISRQDIMVLTARALEKSGDLKPAASTEILNQFNDRAEISGYAESSLAAMTGAGLVSGSGGKLNPQARTTRAEAAVFLYRIYTAY